MASEDLLAGVEFSGPSSDLLEGVQAGGESYKPREDVGFWATAGRTAAQATSPVLRAIDMAAAGLAGAFERLNIPTNLGGRGVGAVRPQPGAPIFPGLAGEQDRVFQAAQERQQGMQEFYGQQPNEQFSLPGSIAGGVASMPVEMVGGMGLQHGIDRSAQVLEAGGTGREAALAGGVTGAVRTGLNLLPVKVGGRVGSAVESRLGGALGGAVTGAAVNVPGEAIGTAAENLALPAAADATLGQRARGKGLAPGMEQLGQDPLDPTNLAVGAGLAGGMGGVAGALAGKAKKKGPPARPMPPEFKPLDGGEFKAPNGATVTQEQWDNASDRIRQGWMKSPKEEKIPAGEAKEVEPPKLTDVVEALPPEGDRARRAEIERLMGETDSAEVKATLKQELGKLDKAQKGRESVAKKAADKAELLATARLAEDPEVKKALLARAEKVLPTEKVPTGEAKEVPVETVEPAPEPIPAGEATELKVETVEPAKALDDTPAEPTVERKPDEKATPKKPAEGQEAAPEKPGEGAVPTDATDAQGGVDPEEVALRKKWPGLADKPVEVLHAQEAWDSAKKALVATREGAYERANAIAEDVAHKWGQKRVKADQVGYLKEVTKRLRRETAAFKKKEATPGTLENARARKADEKRWQDVADQMHKSALEEIDLGEKELRELHRSGRITAADIDELSKVASTSKNSHETATRLHEILAGKKVEGRGGDVGKVDDAANEPVMRSLDRARIESIAVDRAIRRETGRGPRPLSRTDTTHRLGKMVEKYEKAVERDDRATAGEALAKEVERLAEETALKARDKAFREMQRGRERGADYIRQRLLEAKRRGDISEEHADFAEWFILKNPQLFDDAAIAVRTAPEGSKESGRYTPLNRMVTLFKGGDTSSTAVHELLHHLERAMPPDMQAEIRAAYYRDLNAAFKKAIKSGDKVMEEYLRHVMDASLGAPRAADKAMAMLTSGKVPYDAYRLFDQSEYWAVHMTDVAGRRYQSADSLWGRTRQWLREALEHAKGALGLRSQAPMIRALDGLLRDETLDGGSPTMLNRASRDAMSPKGWGSVEPEPGQRLFESEDDFDKALRAKFGGKMIDALRERGLLHYMTGQEGKVGVHTKGSMLERSDNTSHARLYWDQIKRDEAPAVMMHELGEHFGIVRVLGDEHYRVLLGELAEMNKSGDEEVRRAWNTVRTRYPDIAEGSPRFIREVAARLVESAPDMPWVRKLIAQVRAWLYQNFGTTLATRADGDLIRGLAWAALRKLEDGDLPRQDKAAMPRYMRSNEPVAEFSAEMRGDPSVGGAPPRALPLGEEQRSEMLSRKFFDRFNRVARVQKAAGITDEDKDIYLADTLYRGRVQNEGDKLLRDYIEPLGKLLKAAKVEDLTVKDADDFLMALHAPERNAVIAARNDKMPDGGSGLTNQQAADIIDSFTPAQRQHLDAIAGMVHRLNREKLQRMVDGGLITPETRDMLNRQYRNYVPLKTLDEEDAALGIGRGYELRASDITTAMGRKSKAGSPIAASIMDASRVIIRSEKVNVDRTIWNFATDPAAETFMRPYDPANPPASVMKQDIGPDGKVRSVINPVEVLKQTIGLMVNGEQQRIFVDDELLRDQIRKVATSNDPGGVLRAIGRGTGTIGRMLTEFNPAFTIPNAVRDAWTVGLRAPAHGISRWKAVSGIPKAWGAIVNYKRGANTPGARAYEEFQRVGGKIGAYGIQGIADTFRNLENLGAELGYAEQQGGAGRKAMKTLRAVAHVFSQANEVFEYATRLSAYEQARAAGHSQKRAAAIAKDITVNFERSGEYGRVMNSLLVFANAALQGLYGTVRYASNPAVQRGMLGMVALGIASQAWNELMGGVNEETGEPNINTQSDSIADKNLVGLAPDSKGGVKIPLPPEYAALYAMGRRLYRGASQGDWAKEAGGVAGALIDAALPVRLPEAQSGALSVGKAVVPTLAAPFADLWTNQNYFGSPIYVEQRDTTSPAPYYTLTRPQTSVLTKEISEMLNTVTGGDEIEPGLAQRALGPIVAPEGIEHLVGFYTGGAGQFVLQSANFAKAATGDKTAVELNRTPIVNRFAFNEPTSYIGRRYRELEGRLEYARDHMKAGKDVQDERLARALPVFEESARELSRLRKELREAANSGGDTEEIQRQMRAAQSRVIRSYNNQPVQ